MVVDDNYYSQLIIDGHKRKAKANEERGSYDKSDVKKFLIIADLDSKDMDENFLEGLCRDLYQLNKIIVAILDHQVTQKVPMLELLERKIGKNTQDDELDKIPKNLERNDGKLKQLSYVLKSDNMSGGFILSDPNASTFTKSLDLLQLILEIAGFFPVIGDIVDAVNGVIYLLRGDIVSAILSFIGVIPVVGSFISSPILLFRKYRKFRKLQRMNRLRKARRVRRVRPTKTKKSQPYASYGATTATQSYLQNGREGQEPETVVVYR